MKMTKDYDDNIDDAVLQAIANENAMVAQDSADAMLQELLDNQLGVHSEEDRDFVVSLSLVVGVGGSIPEGSIPTLRRIYTGYANSQYV